MEPEHLSEFISQWKNIDYIIQGGLRDPFIAIIFLPWINQVYPNLILIEVFTLSCYQTSEAGLVSLHETVSGN